jgi:Type II secretion system (T2SS), protein E, N-terminal domain
MNLVPLDLLLLSGMRLRLGEMLLRAKLLDQGQLDMALDRQRQWGGRLGDALVSMGLLDEMTLWRGLSKQLQVPLVHLPALQIIRPVVIAVPVALCEQHLVFPISRDGRRITVATGDPTNLTAVDELAFALGCAIALVLAPPREVEWAIAHYHRGDPSPCPAPRQRGSAAPEADELSLAELLIRPAAEQVMPPPSANATDERARLLRVLVETCVSRRLVTTSELAQRWR